MKIIINDETIHRRIKRYRDEETSLSKVLQDLGEIKSEPVPREAYEHMAAASKLIRQRVKIVRGEIETLKRRLSKEFWVGKNYNEV